jgi:hypothetical protein
MLLKITIMKLHKLTGLLPLSAMASFLIGCTSPAYKPMDIAAYNQNTRQWRFDYNLYPLNPNWQYKLVNGKAPGTFAQCPLSDNPADWKSYASCTSQNLHYNDGQAGCTEIFSGHGGHMNWFPVTEVGILNFSDHSSDDDYNFYLQSPDSSLYLWSDDPDPMNQFLALEFDSDEFPDPVDNDYNIWWNRFHDAVDHGDSFWGTILGTGNYAEAESMVKNKLAIVTGMAGIDIGHDNANQATTELHPVYGMFILTDEQTSVNPDGSVAMNDTWSFFIRNMGDEGWCGVGLEYASAKQLKVFIPEMPYYYGGTISPYQADARDNVVIDDGNVHITNWNGITDDNDPRRERWTKQVIKGGVILDFNFDSDYSDGIFVGDIKMNWNIYISFNGFGNLQNANAIVDEAKFKEKFKGMYSNKRDLKKEYETKSEFLLSLRLSKLSNSERAELNQALAGKTIIPGMPKLESFPKGKSTKIGAVFAGKDSINIQQFNARLKKMKMEDMPKQHSTATATANANRDQYVKRKSSKRAFMDAYLKSKHL